MLLESQKKIFVYRGNGDRKKRSIQFIMMRRRKIHAK
jgi:hypothetical protein